MNFSVVLFVALALTGAVNAGPIGSSHELDDIWAEFLALVPQEKAVPIIREYVDSDKEFQALLAYVHGDSFKDLVKKFKSIDDVKNLYKFFNDAGLNIYSPLKALHEVLKSSIRESYEHIEITGGVAGFIADFKAILPIDSIKALYHEKLETSSAFAQVVEQLGSSRFQELVSALRANEEFQKIVTCAKNAGVDLKDVVGLLTTIFGLQFSNTHTDRSVKPNELLNVLHEFDYLLDREKLSEIFWRYVYYDPLFGYAYDYAQSEEFKQLVRIADEFEDVKKFYDYLEEAGLPAYFIVHDVLDLPSEKPGRHARSVGITGGGITGYVADVKAILPVDKIKALQEEKVKSSPIFAKFVQYFKAPRFQEIVDALRDNEEFQKIIYVAYNNGVDVNGVLDLTAAYYGLEFPKPRAL